MAIHSLQVTMRSIFLRNSLLFVATCAKGKVQAAGIMSGVGDNTFSPQEPYTREQSIVTLMRLYAKL